MFPYYLVGVSLGLLYLLIGIAVVRVSRKIVKNWNKRDGDYNTIPHLFFFPLASLLGVKPIIQIDRGSIFYLIITAIFLWPIRISIIPIFVLIVLCVGAPFYGLISIGEELFGIFWDMFKPLVFVQTSSSMPPSNPPAEMQTEFITPVISEKSIEEETDHLPLEIRTIKTEDNASTATA